MNIWKKEEDYFDPELYGEIDDFFEELHDSKKLEYRESQHTMALDILDSMKRREILLIEAGVGSGKSWGYLVPLIYAAKTKKNFKGFIISTSSIALQEQLIKEIETLGEMIDYKMDITIAKGKGNFICKKRLESFIKYNQNESDLTEIIAKVEQGITDRKEFDDVPNKTWNRININQNNCNRCLYNENCGYIIQRKKWPISKSIICNHDLLVESLKRDSEDKLLEDPSILIVDEAHALEDKIRNAYTNTLNKENIEASIYNIYFQIGTEKDIREFIGNPAIDATNKVFRTISTKAKYQLRRNSKVEIDVLDSESSGFVCSDNLKDEIKSLLKYYDEVEKHALSHPHCDKKLINQVDELKKAKVVFNDLLLDQSKRKNIYWAEFLPNTRDHVELRYVQRNLKNVSAQLLNNPNYAKVFTSATLTTDLNNYQYFMNGLGLNEVKGIPVIQEYSQESPYDYESNALLYCPEKVVNPKSSDHNLYLDSVAENVDEIIRVTDGKSLVLFTSKNDMNAVYERLKDNDYNFQLLIQQTGKSGEMLKRKFIEDKSSTLLATGSFWEGIDVKGEALENLIITKLPFPLVNPIMEEKSSYYADGFKEVYLPEMLIKLKQGLGRLIRSEDDKGIVSILDSRVNDYGDYVLGNIPFSNTTSHIEDVKKFAVNKGLDNKEYVKVNKSIK